MQITVNQVVTLSEKNQKDIVAKYLSRWIGEGVYLEKGKLVCDEKYHNWETVFVREPTELDLAILTVLENIGKK